MRKGGEKREEKICYGKRKQKWFVLSVEFSSNKHFCTNTRKLFTETSPCWAAPHASLQQNMPTI
jgi:hypothetical protein